MNQTIIFISGKAQAGKTTTAYLMQKNIEANGKCAVIINYADLLKYICSAYFYWDGKKNDEGRQLLQEIGTDIVRNNDPDFWVDFVKRFVSVFEGSWDYVIIGDCRFKNEISWAKEPGVGGIHLRVVRPGYDNGLTDEQKRHISETDLDDVDPDYLLINDGSVIDLDQKIVSFLESINAGFKYGQI